jgi:hypothetical protein
MLLSEDSERYWLAFVEAHRRRAAAAGVSQNRITEMLIGLRYGKLVETPENVEAYLNGEEKFQVYANPRRGEIPDLGEVSEDSSEHRNKNVFRPITDNTLHKLRIHCQKHRANADRLWLDAMVKSWEICLTGDFDKIEEARKLASGVGEEKAFAGSMLEMLRSRTVQHVLGCETRLPSARVLAQLFPHDTSRQIERGPVSGEKLLTGKM